MNTRHNFGRVIPTAAILLAAFAAGLGLWLGTRALSSTEPGVQTATLFPAARPFGDFSLTQTNGKPLTRADWQGHWTLVFFGFTHCPDICPNTLGILKDVRARLAQAGLADQVTIQFISVDPQRDTLELLARYSAFYSPDFAAATGTDEELTRLTRALGLLYTRSSGSSAEDYNVDHSASIVIIDPQARQLGLFRPPLSAAAISSDMLSLAGKR